MNKELKQNSKPKWLLYLILAGFIAYMMGRLLGNGPVSTEFGEYEAKNAVKQYLYENLRDPDSYEAVAWSKLNSAGGNFIIDHRYRAKNGFGGYNVETKKFIIKDGKVVAVF